MHHFAGWKKRRLPIAVTIAAAIAGLSAVATAAPSDPIKCKRAIVKAAAGYENSRMKALQKCEENLLKGKLPGGSTCPDDDQKAPEKIAKALAKLQRDIAKNCCGNDKTCGTGSGDAADLSLSSIGWSARVPACQGGSRDNQPCDTLADCPNGTGCAPALDRCPNLESGKLPGGACDSQLSHPGDIAQCLSCVGNAAVDQAVRLYYADLHPPGANKAAEKCKQTIGKAAAKFFDKKRKALRKCQDAVLKAGSGSCPDSKALEAIQKAEAAKMSSIAKACGGSDKAFGGGDDISPDLIGAPLSCPGVNVPGGAACNGPIDTVEDLANCVDCVTEFKVDCTDRLATPTAGAYFSECNPLCGNSKFETGETCDDGNLVDGDSCPSTCAVGACVPTGSSLTAAVNFTPPAGTELSGLTVYIDYPDGRVRLPGTGNATSVQDRISVPSGAFFNPNDLDYALKVVLLQADGSSIPSPNLMDITFDACSGPAPAVSDFHCRVLDAASTGISPTPVYGATCSVVLP